MEIYENGSSDEDFIPLFVFTMACTAEPPKKKRKRTHRWWVRPWIGDRHLINQMNTMYKLQLQLEEIDNEEFFRMLRMDKSTFYYVLSKVYDSIKKEESPFRDSIPPAQRLSVTLKYLATGESCISLSQQYRLGPCTVGNIIKETTAAIYKDLKNDFLKTPSTRQEWMETATEFWTKWQYPCCIGAIDGKHIRIRKPPNSGSIYYNYKGFCSIVLLAVVNANYEAIYVDTGAEGRLSDGGIWSNCSLKEHIEADTLNIPTSCMLPNTDKEIPLHMVGDDAFPLCRCIIKPYPHRKLSHDEKIFNYRLSRSRRIVENFFGILSSRFRVLQTQITFFPKTARNIVQACVILHNVLRKRNSGQYFQAGFLDGEDGVYNFIPGGWRNDDNMTGLRATHIRNARQRYKANRDTIKEFFMSDQGKVSWQEEQVDKNYGG